MKPVPVKLSRRNSRSNELIRITDALIKDVRPLSFSPPVTHVYNPLEYARAAHVKYIRMYGAGPKEVVFLGMNPGPWGMCQTGVPFGEVGLVRDWLKINASVGKPAREHPRRPVLGFGCTRSEVSGKRLWGWARGAFGTPECFFSRFFVANYCPLTFMEESGRNRTPDHLPADERRPLFEACDRALAKLVEVLEPRFVIGIGGFAEKRARPALSGRDVSIGRMLHPSPASPAANSDWEGSVQGELRALGILD